MTQSKRALSIAEFSRHYGIGRTRVYEEIRAGRLHAIKIGRRTLIVVNDAEAWLLSRPSLLPANAQEDARYPCHGGPS
jgi:excisionase family DNA binding protein